MSKLSNQSIVPGGYFFNLSLFVSMIFLWNRDIVVSTLNEKNRNLIYPDLKSIIE